MLPQVSQHFLPLGLSSVNQGRNRTWKKYLHISGTTFDSIINFLIKIQLNDKCLILKFVLSSGEIYRREKDKR